MSAFDSKLRLIFIPIFFIICLLLVIYAANVFLLAFAAILLAIFLQTFASWSTSRFGLNYALSLTLVILLLILLLGLLFAIATPLIVTQLSALIEELPKSFQTLQDNIEKITGRKLSEEDWSSALVFKNEHFFKQATAVFSFTLDVVVGFVLFILVGVYLAYSPGRYVCGLLLLFPPKKRLYASNVLAKLGHSLRWWLLGKGISMFAIGLLTMVGLWILKVPLAFILGLLAALLAFIPYIGSIIASIPAILIGLTVSPIMAFYVTLLYLGVHAIEGYCITPFVEQKTVFIPPALTLIVQVLLSLLVGFLGLALTSPLIVLALVLTRELYVKER